MNLELFFSTYYLFDTNPQGDFIWGFILLIFFILLFFIRGFVLSYKPKNKYFIKSFKKKFWAFPFLATIGIILVLCRFGNIPVFSMRFLWFSILLLSVIIFIIQFSRGIRDYKRRVNSASKYNK